MAFRVSMEVAAVAAAVSFGLVVGLGAFTFVYARGYSYLSDNPASCANCHVMWDHYDAWLASSHSPSVTCNDCHTPPGHLEKYLVKARNGFWHSFYFTTGGFPDVLRITPANVDVTQRACSSCHAAIVAAISHGTPDAAGRNAAGSGAALDCMRCHANVGHIVR